MLPAGEGAPSLGGGLRGPRQQDRKSAASPTAHPTPQLDCGRLNPPQPWMSTSARRWSAPSATLPTASTSQRSWR